MTILNPTNSTTSTMTSTVTNYSVASETLDTSTGDETIYDNPDFPKFLGYYKKIPQLRQSVNALALWTAGKGWEADNFTVARLEQISGWGEDTFQSIMMNMLVMKKVNGDAYAEIIRDSDTDRIINLKPLNPSTIRIITDRKGIIKRYEEYEPSTQQVKRNLKTTQVFHLCNDRVASENHGVSIIESCQWIIDAMNEAMTDYRRILHRGTIRVMEVDADDTTTLNAIKVQYAEAVKKGELLLVPKGSGVFQDLTPPPAATFLEWIKYLESYLYSALGIPKVITGGSSEYTEAGSKMGYMTFEQVYITEQTLLEEDIFAQLGWNITFNKPISLKHDVAQDEAANTGQVNIQPNAAQAGVGQ